MQRQKFETALAARGSDESAAVLKRKGHATELALQSLNSHPAAAEPVDFVAHVAGYKTEGARNYSATRIQAAARGRLARKALTNKKREQKLRRLNALVRVQAFARALKARRITAAMRKRRNKERFHSAVLRIQAAFRGHKVRVFVEKLRYLRQNRSGGYVRSSLKRNGIKPTPSSAHGSMWRSASSRVTTANRALQALSPVKPPLGLEDEPAYTTSYRTLVSREQSAIPEDTLHAISLVEELQRSYSNTSVAPDYLMAPRSSKAGSRSPQRYDGYSGYSRAASVRFTPTTPSAGSWARTHAPPSAAPRTAFPVPSWSTASPSYISQSQPFWSPVQPSHASHSSRVAPRPPPSVASNDTWWPSPLPAEQYLDTEDEATRAATAAAQEVFRRRQEHKMAAGEDVSGSADAVGKWNKALSSIEKQLSALGLWQSDSRQQAPSAQPPPAASVSAPSPGTYPSFPKARRGSAARTRELLQRMQQRKGAGPALFSSHRDKEYTPSGTLPSSLQYFYADTQGMAKPPPPPQHGTTSSSRSQPTMTSFQELYRAYLH